MPLEPGQTLSHYRLVEKIGQGGMGVVWKAEDTRLRRQVALKVLPDTFAKDQQRLSRFEREARFLASLDHPNIATIYGLEESDGTRFLAMELVSGKSLAEQVAKGPLPVEEALNLCCQIAEALEAAHAKGVIHRDLKPANVMMTSEGKVKVLDFGLAKAFGAASSASELTEQPTLTLGETAEQIILGTTPYMSPEQASGKPVDKRTDIWSFGCILDELLTGRRAFAGETVSSTIAAIHGQEPDWDRLPADTPVEIRKLLRRCLQKDADRRLHDIADARIELEEIAAGGFELTAQEMRRAPPSMLRRIGWPIVVLFAVVSAIALIRDALQPESLPRAVEMMDLTLPGMQFGFSKPVEVSPDGRSIAFFRDGRLWVRDVDRLEPRELTDTAAALMPFWSPDSKWLGFVAEGRMWKIPATGGDRVVIAKLPTGVYTGAAGGVSWSENGTIVFSTGWSGLLSVPAQGGGVTEMLPFEHETELDFHQPSWLPKGRGIVFVVHRAEKYWDRIGLYANDQRDVLLEIPGESIVSPTYSSTGHILFQRRGTDPGVWALPFSLDQLRVTGEPFPVMPGAGPPSVADDGTLVAIAETARRLRQLVVVNSNGRIVRSIGEPRQNLYFLKLSPDGTRVATSTDDSGNEDVWVMDVETGNANRITYGSGEENHPSWSPDGNTLAYQCFEGVVRSICLAPADGTGEPRLVHPGALPNFTADGKGLSFVRFTEGGRFDLMHRSLAEGSEAAPVVRDLEGGMFHSISPSGDYLAYEAIKGAVPGIFITRFPSGEGKWQVSSGGGTIPTWSADGNLLYFVQGDQWMVAAVTYRPWFSIGEPRPILQELDKDVIVGRLFCGSPLPDGDGFIMLRNVTESGAPPRVVIFRNWLAAKR